MIYAIIRPIWLYSTIAVWRPLDLSYIINCGLDTRHANICINTNVHNPTHAKKLCNCFKCVYHYHTKLTIITRYFPDDIAALMSCVPILIWSSPAIQFRYQYTTRQEYLIRHPIVIHRNTHHVFRSYYRDTSVYLITFYIRCLCYIFYCYFACKHAALLHKS